MKHFPAGRRLLTVTLKVIRIKRFIEDTQNHNQSTMKISQQLTPWALLAMATVAWANPSLAQEESSLTSTDYFNGQTSIEIYVPPPERQTSGMCSQLLEPAIKGIIGSYPNNWGIHIESLVDGTVLYTHNADRFFIPASNTKLITTAAALERLDPLSAIGNKSLKDWVSVTNQRSNNYYADTLLRHIGGSTVAKTTLSKLGINPNDYRLADGSGLSRANKVKPRTLVQLLRVMYYSPERDVFYASLPVAGVSGTLRNRMRKTPAQGTVRAKTGTLRGVRALSGYIEHPQYGILIFSILANNPYISGSSLVSSIDKIVLQTRMATNCN